MQTSSELLAAFKRLPFLHLWFGITIITTGLIINCVQCILFCGLKPINKRVYRKLGYYLCFSYFSLFVFLGDWWSNSKLYVYIDPDILRKRIGQEHALVLANHTYEIDWLFGLMICDKQNVLGSCKAFAKKSVKYIPAIGWALQFAEYIFLERSFEKDKIIIDRQVNEIFDNSIPSWLVLNAEGTRFTKDKHETCNMFCRDRGVPELKHHLIPRAKGFQSSLGALKAKCPSIIDMQLAFKEDAEFEPTLGNLMMGRPIIGYMHLRLIDMHTVPQSENKSAEWLQQLFREKDSLQDSFHAHGDFFTGTNLPRLEPIEMQPRLHSLVNTIGWIIVTLIPIVYYLAKLVFSGDLLHFAIGGGILLIFHFMTQKICEMSEISKSSSYGSSAALT